jgi:hypothetical protein
MFAKHTLKPKKTTNQTGPNDWPSFDPVGLTWMDWPDKGWHDWGWPD